MSQWTENKWTERAAAVVSETGAALQLVFDEVPRGQQKQLVKNPEIKAVFDRFGVVYEDDNAKKHSGLLTEE